MSLNYRSTRGKGGQINSLEAIVKGIADDGGLFVPLNIEKIDKSVEALSKMTYQ